MKQTNRLFIAFISGVLVVLIVFGALKTFLPDPETNGNSNSEQVVAEEAPEQLSFWVNRISAIRTEQGLYPVTYSSKLTAAAQAKTDDMIKLHYFSHTGPSGKTYIDFSLEAKYSSSSLGEILSEGFLNRDGSLNNEKVIDAWLKSPTHKEVILDPKYSQIGIGVTKGKFQGRDTIMVAIFFGSPYKF